MDQNPPTRFSTLTLSPAIDCTVRLDRPLTPRELHHVLEEAVRPGGKGINVARVLAARGAPVAAGGLLGQDNTAPFERLLAETGIQNRFERVPGETRRNLMIVHEGLEYKINRPSFPDLHYEEVFVRAAVIRLVAGSDVTILSGALPVQFPRDTYARVGRTLRAMGVRVVLDASGEALREGVAARPVLIKPNRVECEELLGRPLGGREALRGACAELAARFDTVIVSDGPRGAWFAQGPLVLHASSPDVPVRDTTAAGDMLLGEFCAGFFPAERLTPELAARAVATGAAAVERGDSRCPGAERVEELRRQVVLTDYS